MDEAVHLLVSWIENELDDCHKNLKDMDSIKLARGHKLKEILTGAPTGFKSFGPKQNYQLEQAPPPSKGTFRDPAEFFKEIEE